MEIEGKVALVTGAGAAGTGRAIARALAERGATVAVNDLDDEGGTRTVELIEADGGTAGFVRADVTQEDEIRAAIRFAVDTFGGLDILVNNAGGTAVAALPGRAGRALEPHPRPQPPRADARDPACTPGDAKARRRGRRQHLLGRGNRLAAAQLARVRRREGGPRAAHGDARSAGGKRQGPRELHRPELDRDPGGAHGARGDDPGGASRGCRR